jgi:hypothetical protein
MKWLSVVILVCLCIAGFAQKDFHSLDDIIVLTRNLDTVNLSFTSQPSIILLASENTCSRCYETLENELNSQKTIDKINLIAVVRLPNCNPCRREFLKKYNIFKYCDSIYFDLHQHQGTFIDDEYKDGLWQMLEIARTPAVIIIYPDRLVVYKYEQIFTGLQVSRKFKKEFRSFLKQSL